MQITHRKISFLAFIQQIFEWNTAIGDKIIRWYRCIVKNSKGQRLGVINTMFEVFIPDRRKGFLFGGRLCHMSLVYVYRNIRVYKLFIRFSKRHVEAFLKVRRPQPTSLAYFYTNSPSKHLKLVRYALTPITELRTPHNRIHNPKNYIGKHLKLLQKIDIA